MDSKPEGKVSDLATLRTAKQALEEGLITQNDFDSVKEGFLNAQRIKAGMDAGFIPGDDFAAASAAFFESLGVHSHGHGVVRRPAQASASATVTTVGRRVVNGGPGSHKAKASEVGRPSVSSGLPHRVNSLPTPVKPVVASSKVSMAGISVDENAVEEFNQMRGKSKYLWMMFKIDDSGSTVVLSETANSESDFNEFVRCLPENECRYAVFDYAYETSEGRNLQKLVFVNWAPDTAPVKSKMMVASTKDFFKNCLGGVQVELQVTDYDEISDEDVSRAVAATLTRG